MKIDLNSIKISDHIDGYVNDPNTGVRGCHGQLDIRPPISASSAMTKSSNRLKGAK